MCALSGIEAYVVAREVVDGGFCEHAVVCVLCQPLHMVLYLNAGLTLELGLSKRRCVAGDDDEFRLAGS